MKPTWCSFVLVAADTADCMPRFAWALMYRLSPYADCTQMAPPLAESLADRVVYILNRPWRWEGLH